MQHSLSSQKRLRKTLWEKCLNLVSLHSTEDNLGWLVSKWNPMSWCTLFKVSPAPEVKGKGPKNLWAWFLKVRIIKLRRRTGRKNPPILMRNPLSAAITNQKKLQVLFKCSTLKKKLFFTNSPQFWAVWSWETFLVTANTSELRNYLNYTKEELKKCSSTQQRLQEKP